MRWWIGFKDGVQTPFTIEKGNLGKDALERFDRAKTEGINGQHFDRICIYDSSAESDNIVVCHNITRAVVAQMIMARIIPPDDE